MATTGAAPSSTRRRWRWVLAAASAPLIANILLTQTAEWFLLGEMCCHWSLHCTLLLLPAVVVFRRERPWGPLLAFCLALGSWPWLLAAWEPRARLIASPGAKTKPAEVRVLQANIYSFNPTRDECLTTVTDSRAKICVLAEVQRADRARMLGNPDWPNQVWEFANVGPYPIALLSAYPIIWSRRHDLSGGPAIEAQLMIEGRPLRVLAIHLYSPMNTEHARHRDHQLAVLAALAAASPDPVLMLGDFNCTVASPAWRSFREVSGLCRAPGIAGATWNSAFGPFGITIDHILVRPGLGLDQLAILPLPGSDHRGVIARVSIP